jgi:hypothetical protein
MDVKSISDNDLILLRKEIDRELQTRGISFSVGEIGESIAINFFYSTPGLSNLIRAPIGAKNVDALSRDGDRYSIKTSQKGKKTGTIYPDSSSADKQLFEYLLIVKLASDFSLESIYRFSWSQFLIIRAWDRRMNAWYVPLSQSRLTTGECLFTKDN